MKKKKIKDNFEDYSSGRVIYGAKNATNFSVKIVKEVFEFCGDYFIKNKIYKKYKVYDPFCGVGYLLTVLGFLYSNKLENIYASDVDDYALEFANKNLSLLTKNGINKRIEEIKSMILSFNKNSHKEALESAYKFQNKRIDLLFKIFKFDAIINKSFPTNLKNVDLVFADIPYGKLTKWNTEEVDPVQIFLNNLKSILNKESLVIIISNKKQEIKFDGFQRIKKMKFGHRKIFILKVFQ
jgi:16S rRNA G966 N2-methylase RsmD